MVIWASITVAPWVREIKRLLKEKNMANDYDEFDDGQSGMGPMAQAMMSAIRARHPSWLSQTSQPDPVTAAAAGVLNLIGKHEAAGDPNAIGASWKSMMTPLPKAASQTKIQDLINWQRQPENTMESVTVDPYKPFPDPGPQHAAVGLYQIKPNTLSGAAGALGLLDQPFTVENQNRLGVKLLNGRQFTDYLTGKIGDADFTANAAKEWDSIPVDANGLNRSGRKTQMSYQAWLDTLYQAKATYDAANGAGADDETP